MFDGLFLPFDSEEKQNTDIADMLLNNLVQD